MGRLATPRHQGGISLNQSDAEADKKTSDPDGYSGRVLKYIPGETVTAYVGLQAVLTEPSPLWLGIFLFLLVGTFLYIYQSRNKGEPWILNAILCTLAFILWSYALHDPDKFSPWAFKPELYSPVYSAAFLILFTFGVGALAPKTNVKGNTRA